MIRIICALLLGFTCMGCCGYFFMDTSRCATLRRPQVMETSCCEVTTFDECCPFLPGDEPNDPLYSRECLPPLKPVTEEDLKENWDQEYHLGIGDILEISIFGEEESTINHVLVAPDGKIYYSILEGIPAAGRTPSDVSKEFQAKLSDFYLSPVVTISPKEMNNLTYNILGRVNQPGMYYLRQTTTLREAIAEAGGFVEEDEYYKESNHRFTGTADLKRSFVVRGDHRLDIDFEQLIFTADDSQNVVIRPGDYIYIAPLEQDAVYVLGGVRINGRLPFEKGMTLMYALASSAGWIAPGYWYSPDLSRVLILRGALECPCVLQTDIQLILNGQARDVFLAPGDIIYVYNKDLRFGRELIRLALDAFVNNFASAAANYYIDQWMPLPTMKTKKEDKP